jgi:hypothetical protein
MAKKTAVKEVSEASEVPATELTPKAIAKKEKVNGTIRNQAGVIIGNVIGESESWGYVAIQGYKKDGKAITSPSSKDHVFRTAREAVDALQAISAEQGWPTAPKAPEEPK